MENGELLVQTKSGECRRCRHFCDKLIEPIRCHEMECRYLYAYTDEINGRTYTGCLHKVFKVEIDRELMLEMERSRYGFGGIKVAEAPLPHCPFEVDVTFMGEGEDFECGNMPFFDCSGSERYCYKISEKDRKTPA